jgi:hypothetical protein
VAWRFLVLVNRLNFFGEFHNLLTLHASCFYSDPLEHWKSEDEGFLIASFTRFYFCSENKWYSHLALPPDCITARPWIAIWNVENELCFSAIDRSSCSNCNWKSAVFFLFELHLGPNELCRQRFTSASWFISFAPRPLNLRHRTQRASIWPVHFRFHQAPLTGRRIFHVCILFCHET